MEKGIYKHIEQILRDYPYLDKYIQDRRRDLMYPHDEHPDKNIGGGRSNISSNPTENLAITISDDRQIAALEKNREVITDCLERVDEDTQIIIGELYLKKHPTLTLTGIAEAIHSSRSSLSRKRTDFFEMVKNEMGW